MLERVSVVPELLVCGYAVAMQLASTTYVCKLSSRVRSVSSTSASSLTLRRKLATDTDNVTMANAKSPLPGTKSETGDHIYSRWFGLRPVINCIAPFTSLGGSRMAKEVVSAQKSFITNGVTDTVSVNISLMD